MYKIRRHEQTNTTERASTSEGNVDEVVCPECDADVIYDPERAEQLCESCGLVVNAEPVDRGPEWHSFSPEEKKSRSRVGAPSTNRLHDKGLSTTIDWRNADASGKSLDTRQRELMGRLRVWDERFRAKSNQERNLKQALGEIDRMAAALGLPENVRETAGVLYRRALEEELLPGRSIEGMATACLYGAARQTGIARSLAEISDVSRVKKLRIQRAYRYLVRELELGIEPTDPTTYVNRFNSELALSAESEHVARDLLETAMSLGLHSGKSPTGLAASAVYAASYLANESVTQQQVSEVTQVSTVTIRKRYRELLEAQANDEPA